MEIRIRTQDVKYIRIGCHGKIIFCRDKNRNLIIEELLIVGDEEGLIEITKYNLMKRTSKKKGVKQIMQVIRIRQNIWREENRGLMEMAEQSRSVLII